MSVIGPRPALWNQDVLIAEREKYHANDVKPGLTGWAQINGRDELEIPVKAKLDGEYVEKESLLFDIKCFLGTIGSVLSSDGVVEGGTGELTKAGIIIIIMVVNLALTFTMTPYSSIITSYERFSFIKITNLIYTILKPVVMIPLLLWGYKAIALSIVRQ